MKILVLDDDELVLKIVVRSLKRLGHIPAAFSTEQEMMDQLESTNPDLLILDQMLGGVRTGIQLVSEVRQLCPEIPIVIVSGYPGPELNAAVALNDVSFLAKPFTMDSLSKCITES